MSADRGRVRWSSSFLLGVSLDAAQLSAPVLGEDAAPFVNGAKRVGVGPIQTVAAIPPDADQADVTEHGEVLRYGGLGELEGVRDFSDRSLFRRDQLEDMAAARLGDGVERVGGRACPRHAYCYTFPYRNV